VAWSSEATQLATMSKIANITFMAKLGPDSRDLNAPILLLIARGGLLHVCV